MRPAPPLAALVLAGLLVAGTTGPLPVARAGGAAPAGGGDARIAKALTGQRLRNVRFEATPLEGVLAWLRTATGLNYVIDRKVLAKAGIDPESVTLTAQLDDVTAATLLDLLLEPHDLAVVVRRGVVLVTTRAASLGKPVTRIWSISHITYTKVDFIAPDINLNPSGYTPPEEYEPERVVEDDPLATGDAVLELVKEMVATDLWDSEGWSIRATDRYLVVRAPRLVQVQVGRALDLIATLK